VSSDIRDLLSRMADELDHYRQLLSDDRREVHALATEARAALAAEPVGEVGELVAWLHGQDGGRERRAIHSRVATLLQQQQHLLGLACQELDNFLEQQQTAPAPVVVPPQAGEGE